ncbi:MAG: GntR family transcriptional regulator [Rubrivivax sp.]|nr:GntR family transcriptional regulator [Rubrivivax sp.]
MRKSSHHGSELARHLEDLASQAQAGERLPPIRDFMRRFGVSQGVVQRAFDTLKERGLIDSQVGRGTFFVRPSSTAAAAASPGAPRAAAPKPASAVRSVLLLRRSISIVRGRVLVDELRRRFAAGGHRVLEVSYTDPEHARAVLKGLPHFDACVVQSTYKTLTIDVLAALREKCDVLAVDGTALVGADVESVGTEWGGPLAAAVASLRQLGHRHIAYATTSHSFLAGELGRHRLELLRAEWPDTQFELVEVARLPDDDYEAALVQTLLARRDDTRRLPFTALVAWGVEDGARFQQQLAHAGLTVPAALSVVLLGRTDLVNEHAGFFEVRGCRVADQVEQLLQAIVSRWADPAAPYRVRLVPLAAREGSSMAPPAAASPRVKPAAATRAKQRPG